jgi:hypothetical protein
MSLALLPRLHFKGRFETDVCTANNDDVVRPIDPVRVAVRFGSGDVPNTDEAFIEWMRTGTGRPRASWNYYGGNGCRFIDCKVVSADRGNGLLTAAGADPAIGAAVLLGENPPRKAGIMVDLNPEGTWGTQIYTDRMQLVSGAVQLQGPPTVASSRWLHFGRNTQVGGFTGAGATWQACIPKEGLIISPGATGAIAELHAAAMANKGLVIRYCTYLLSPQISGGELLQRYAQKQNPPNPAVGVVIGTIGVWQDGDYSSMMNGRLLLPTGDLTWDHGDVAFGPAVVAVDTARRTAVIDMITAVPEIDAAGTKLPAGNAELIAFPDNGSPAVSIGPVIYDLAAYETGGGTVELALTAEKLAAMQSGTLSLVFGGTAMLAERDLVVDTDDRNIYMNQGEERTVTFRVLYRGGVPASPVRLRIQQRFNPEKATSAPVPKAQRAMEHPDTVETDGQGIARITVKARAPMLGFLHCFVDGQPEAPSPTRGCLVNFRAFAEDNYDHIQDAELNFPLIYQEVLRYYHVVYPAMTRHFSLADEGDVIANADGIRGVMAPAMHDKWAYMPRTREMSAGKRKLLFRWLDIVAR